MFQHIRKSTTDLFRVYAMHNPIRLFFALGLPFLILWLFGIWRFLYFYYLDPIDTWKVQSLILAWTSLIIAIQFFALAVIWDIINKNKLLLEDGLYLTKKKFYNKKKK
jgi:hypothetical protein